MSTDVQTVDTGLDKQSRRRSKDTEKAHRRSSNFQNKKFKHDHKFRKKIAANGKFFPPYKKRNKDFIIPPTKFLLGGNITDPLNLNSLQDEDINRAMNAVTPKSSPLPTPKHRKGEIEVIIPPDITDPLNLIAGDDDATYEAMLISPVKKNAKKQKNKKKRHRNNRASSGPGSGKEDSIEGAKLDETETPPAKEESAELKGEANKDVKTEDETKDTKETPQGPPPAKRHKCEHNNRANLRKIELKERKADLDKIVSPVIPQPGAWNDRHRFRPPQRTPQLDKSQAKEMPKFKEKDAKFQFGNYCRYYGYRNPHHGPDTRLRLFEKHKHLFEGKDVLDIGCNTGHLTLAVARDLRPNRVVGMDIDRSLIKAARSNIRHYVNCGREDKFFPVSMPIVYGPIEIPGVNEEKGFPHNITFVHGNYVLESDVLVSLEQPQFDVILCLSITKWIQLNWGDAGLKRAFKRMFAQLRPGGVLILEAQTWSSYKRKRNLTPETWKNYHAMELFPHHFSQYLLTEVGFSKCEVMGAPVHPVKGFQRPIQMYIKEDPSFDTPRPLGNNTERFESYSFRLPDSVHCSEDLSGDSNFPYETPNSFNSPESGFSEGLHPRRYPMRFPMFDIMVGGGGGGEGPSTSEENTALSADSSSQENVTCQEDDQQQELSEQNEQKETIPKDEVVQEEISESDMVVEQEKINEHDEQKETIPKDEVVQEEISESDMVVKQEKTNEEDEQKYTIPKDEVVQEEISESDMVVKQEKTNEEDEQKDTIPKDEVVQEEIGESDMVVKQEKTNEEDEQKYTIPKDEVVQEEISESDMVVKQEKTNEQDEQKDTIPKDEVLQEEISESDMVVKQEKTNEQDEHKVTIPKNVVEQEEISEECGVDEKVKESKKDLVGEQDEIREQESGDKQVEMNEHNTEEMNLGNEQENVSEAIKQKTMDGCQVDVSGP
ncbi:7SK snRNA methylphosphate capping enzyme-like [Macrosteles quadrilineatus]|uniref:7SK snRNA methylphosphate capping enzyme-like n=1 Tax=Macrosteles quadrilineatus TaxID=74068 RepID=UPI0023E0CE1D|nr:7SK snRNA methylphosphate capping enzyme-like [Macrosteles quadrilineatus]